DGKIRRLGSAKELLNSISMCICRVSRSRFWHGTVIFRRRNRGFGEAFVFSSGRFVDREVAYSYFIRYEGECLPRLKVPVLAWSGDLSAEESGFRRWLPGVVKQYW